MRSPFRARQMPGGKFSKSYPTSPSRNTPGRCTDDLKFMNLRNRSRRRTALSCWEVRPDNSPAIACLGFVFSPVPFNLNWDFLPFRLAMLVTSPVAWTVVASVAAGAGSIASAIVTVRIVQGFLAAPEGVAHWKKKS